MYTERCISITQLKPERNRCQECSKLFSTQRSDVWVGPSVGEGSASTFVDRAARGEGAEDLRLGQCVGGDERLGTM